MFRKILREKNIKGLALIMIAFVLNACSGGGSGSVGPHPANTPNAPSLSMSPFPISIMVGESTSVTTTLNANGVSGDFTVQFTASNSGSIHTSQGGTSCVLSATINSCNVIIVGVSPSSNFFLTGTINIANGLISASQSDLIITANPWQKIGNMTLNTTNVVASDTLYANLAGVVYQFDQSNNTWSNIDFSGVASTIVGNTLSSGVWIGASNGHLWKYANSNFTDVGQVTTSGPITNISPWVFNPYVGDSAGNVWNESAGKWVKVCSATGNNQIVQGIVEGSNYIYFITNNGGASSMTLWKCDYFTGSTISLESASFGGESVTALTMDINQNLYASTANDIWIYPTENVTPSWSIFTSTVEGSSISAITLFQGIKSQDYGRNFMYVATASNSEFSYSDSLQWAPLADSLPIAVSLLIVSEGNELYAIDANNVIWQYTNPNQ